MNEMPIWVIAVIALLFVILPLLVGFLGLHIVSGAIRMRRHGKWVSGTVVEVKEIRHLGKNPPYNYSYQQVFEFAAPDGRLLRGVAGSYNHQNSMPVGTRRDILVDFGRPEMVFLTATNRLVTGAIIALIGLGIAGFGCYTLFGVFSG